MITKATQDQFNKIQYALGLSIRSFLVGSGAPPRYTRSDPYDGLVGPGSAMWLVHSDVSTLVGGIRALLVQTLHPLVMAGVADHSDYKHDSLGRLHRTAIFLGHTTFGNYAEAVNAIETVRRVHDRVHGFTPDGRPYSAHDSHLLNWVHCTEVDSFWQCRVRYGAEPMPLGTADRYVAEMAEIGRRMGIDNPPTSAAALQAHLSAFIPELEVNQQTRDAVQFLIWPQIPFVSRAPYAVLFSAAVGMLPPVVKRMLRLQIPRLAEVALVRPSALMVLRTVKWALGPRPELAAAESELAAKTGQISSQAPKSD